MANSRPAKRTFSVAEIPLTPSSATTGVWASQLASNKLTFHKAAAATTSVVNIPIKKDAAPGSEDNRIASISVSYTVATAALSSAPTAALRVLTTDATSGALTATTIAGALTFSGTNTVGTAAGTYFATFTPTTPTQIADTSSVILELTMNEAATSVLDINSVKVDYTG